MKLTRYYNKIENLIESLNFQIDDLNEEIEMIEQKSLDFDRDLTDREQEKLII